MKSVVELLPVVVLVVLACRPSADASKGAASDSASSAPQGVDSLATPAGASASDRELSGAPEATDSVRRAKAVPSDSAAGRAKVGVVAPQGEVLGHDSAFGPKFVLDSTGKLIPITKKRP